MGSVIHDEVEEQNRINVEHTIRMEKFVGNLTGWRGVSEDRKIKVFRGHTKIMGVLARFKV